MARASTWQVRSCSSARLLGAAAACVLGFDCHAEVFGWQAFGCFKNYVDEQLDRWPGVFSVGPVELNSACPTPAPAAPRNVPSAEKGGGVGSSLYHRDEEVTASLPSQALALHPEALWRDGPGEPQREGEGPTPLSLKLSFHPERDAQHLEHVSLVPALYRHCMSGEAQRGADAGRGGESWVGSVFAKQVSLGSPGIGEAGQILQVSRTFMFKCRRSRGDPEKVR